MPWPRTGLSRSGPRSVSSQLTAGRAHDGAADPNQRPDPAARELYKAISDPVTGKVTMYNTQTGELGAGQPQPPKAGEVKSGYRFKGGDPADQKNWEKV